MADSYKPSQVSLEKYSLSQMKNELRESQNAELDSVTMTVGFDSPDTFTHKWTFEDVNNLDDYQAELKETKDSAWRRLRKGWKGGDQSNQDFRSKVKNEVSIKIKDMPSEILEFKDDKKRIDVLEQAVNRTEAVYEKSGDSSRNRNIARRMTESSDNVQQFLENMEKVDETLDFEDNVEGQWQEGRQRTTGDLTWHMEDGTKVFTQINSNQVVHQLGGAGGNRIEFDKDRGREFFEENRIA